MLPEEWKYNKNTTPLHTIRMAKFQSTDSTNVGKDMEQQELSLFVGTAIE